MICRLLAGLQRLADLDPLRLRSRPGLVSSPRGLRCGAAACTVRLLVCLGSTSHRPALTSAR